MAIESEQIDTTATEILDLIDTDTGADDATGGGGANTESDTGSDDNIDAVAAVIEQAIGDEETPEADTEAEEEAETPTGDEPATAAPPIDPPASWKADEKERFKALPPETQKYLVERESEREADYSRKQQETASFKREVETERQAVQKERESYAKHVDTHIQQVDQLFKLFRQANPLIAKGDATNWDAEYARNPVEAAANEALYKRELDKLGQIANGVTNSTAAAREEAAKLAETQRTDSFKKAIATIQAHPELGPIWKDDAKRKELQDGLHKFLGDQGLAESERQIEDPRALVIAKMAMERAAQTVPYAELKEKADKLDKLMAEQAKIAAAKVTPKPSRVAKPGASSDDDGASPKDKAVLARVAKTGNIRDQAALIASIL